MSTFWKNTQMPERLEFDVNIQIDDRAVSIGKLVYIREDVVEDIVRQRFAEAERARQSMDTRCRCVVHPAKFAETEEE